MLVSFEILYMIITSARESFQLISTLDYWGRLNLQFHSAWVFN